MKTLVVMLVVAVVGMAFLVAAQSLIFFAQFSPFEFSDLMPGRQ